MGGCAGGPIPFGGRHATSLIAGPAGAKGSFLVRTCQMGFGELAGDVDPGDLRPSLAAEAGCRLLAEGVETGAEADTVLALGVDLGQGYFFGHPERVEAWAVAGEAGEPRDRRPVLER